MWIPHICSQPDCCTCNSFCFPSICQDSRKCTCSGAPAAAGHAHTCLLLQRSAVESGPEGTHHQNLNSSQETGDQGGLSQRQVQAEGSLSGNADASSSASSNGGVSHAARGTLFTTPFTDAVRPHAQHLHSRAQTSSGAVSGTSDLQQMFSPQQDLQLSSPKEASFSEGFSPQVGRQTAYLTSSNNQDKLLYAFGKSCAGLFTASAGSPGQ